MVSVKGILKKCFLFVKVEGAVVKKHTVWLRMKARYARSYFITFHCNDLLTIWAQANNARRCLLASMDSGSSAQNLYSFLPQSCRAFRGYKLMDTFEVQVFSDGMFFPRFTPVGLKFLRCRNCRPLFTNLVRQV